MNAIMVLLVASALVGLVLGLCCGLSAILISSVIIGDFRSGGITE